MPFLGEKQAAVNVSIGLVYSLLVTEVSRDSMTALRQQIKRNPWFIYLGPYLEAQEHAEFS